MTPCCRRKARIELFLPVMRVGRNFRGAEDMDAYIYIYHTVFKHSLPGPHVPLTTDSRIFPGRFLASTTPKAPRRKPRTTRIEVGRRRSVGRRISVERIAYEC